MYEPRPALGSVGPPRLLAGLDRTGRLDRVGHLTLHGSPPRFRPDELADLAENVDLRGRGGAGFPFARKVQAVTRSTASREGRCNVVVNGSEGEPACLKDTALWLHVPHLVLDGAQLAAESLGAEEVVVGVTRSDVHESASAAIAERGPTAVRLRVVRLPERFVTGEGTALVAGISGAAAVPAGRRVRTSDRGLGGLPTLLSNTETFAQLAVAARLGALAYRAAGLPDEPGTLLLTIAGRVVVETPTGVPLPYVLRQSGMDAGQGVLVGGYHGRWLTPRDANAALVSRQSLSAYDAVLGAGAVLPLPEDTCPAGEVARVTRWMAGESAGQCGPCANGLPALAKRLEDALVGDRRAFGDLEARMRAVRRRGACSHPDGTAAFVASALAVFADEFHDHAHGRGCGRAVLGALPLPPDAAPPEPDGRQQLVVDWTLCKGHGLCADVLPDVVSLDPDGFPAQASMPVPPRQRARALRAVRRCPALALRMQE
ncbi:NADH-quinone oxidoreductase subunit NuoF family protein [Streptomyces sp. NRRL S-87]|uniref:NADH-quinone oxidoreductase subunit NuoF family protein n=1 Tax=Streptomyces sp. NRRL S-87 TaxID=1463920 RepID=UPI000A9D5E0E|nr:NADH-quinone oxidoreductase subunit NuoF family protein [Streptomyces sp. NRRL S-87]